MQKEGLASGVVRLVYASDGEDIATYIKEKLSGYGTGLLVEIAEIGTVEDVTNPLSFNGVLLTPEMKDELSNTKRQDKTFLTSTSSVNVILCHNQSVPMSDEDIKGCIGSWFPGSTCPWTIIHITDDTNGFKLALINIIDAVREPSNTLPNLLQFKLMPKRVWTDRDDVIISFKRETNGCKVVAIVKTGKEEKTINATELNPYTYTFKPTGVVEGQAKIEVTVNGESYGTANIEKREKMDLLSDILFDIANPFEFLCQALNLEFADQGTLDRELTDILTDGEQNILAGFHEFAERSSVLLNKSKKEIPTLLHFGAKFGLTSFCRALLTLPGSKAARKMKNRNDADPSKIALKCGFTDLASELQEIDAFHDSDLQTCNLKPRYDQDEDFNNDNQKEDGYMAMHLKQNKMGLYSSIRTLKGRRTTSADGPPLPPREDFFGLSKTTMPRINTEPVMKRPNSDKIKLNRTEAVYANVQIPTQQLPSNLGDSGVYGFSDGSDYDPRASTEAVTQATVPVTYMGRYVH